VSDTVASFLVHVYEEDVDLEPLKYFKGDPLFDKLITYMLRKKYAQRPSADMILSAL
jgi:hypothetical protein